MALWLFSSFYPTAVIAFEVPHLVKQKRRVSCSLYRTHGLVLLVYLWPGIQLPILPTCLLMFSGLCPRHREDTSGRSCA